MNTKLHAVADAKGRLIGFFMSAGQISDYTGAAALLGSLPKAGWLLADTRGLKPRLLLICRSCPSWQKNWRHCRKTACCSSPKTPSQSATSPRHLATGFVIAVQRRRCQGRCTGCAKRGRPALPMRAHRIGKSRPIWRTKTLSRLIPTPRRQTAQNLLIVGSPSWLTCPTSLMCWTERCEMFNKNNRLQSEVAARRGVEPLFSG